MQKSPRFWITAAASAGFLALAPMALAATPASPPAEHTTMSQPAEHSAMNSHETTTKSATKPMSTAQNTTKHESTSSKTMSSEHAPAHSTHMKSETTAHNK